MAKKKAQPKVVMGRPTRAGAAANIELRVRMTQNERQRIQRLADKLTDGDVSAVVRMALERLEDVKGVS